MLTTHTHTLACMDKLGVHANNTHTHTLACVDKLGVHANNNTH